MRSLFFLVTILAFSLYSCNSTPETKNKKTFTTPLGLEKSYPEPTQKLMMHHRTALFNYDADPNYPDNIIWLGRRTAYMGKYQEAIEIFTEGIEKYPDNPRFYRHRGHRYISIREYDKAIADLEKAAELIRGTNNEIEPDGMPNDRNIPVSTLHGNIYYHLGLAYYLVHDYERAYEAYLNCRNTGNNPDNIVSSTHWLYMIQKRMGNDSIADAMLVPIEPGFDVIENHDYYNLCLFYKELLPIDSLKINGDSPSSDALKYGIANWYFYNNETDKAENMFETMMQGDSWTSFGYLAAESDLQEYFD